MKQERNQDINKYISVLEKSKVFREDFIDNRNPMIGRFLFDELVELTFESFHGIFRLDYEASKS